MASVVIGSPESEHVEVAVLGRAHPDATDFWDGNWVRCRISVRVGAWAGDFAADLQTDEFVRFRAGVERLYAALDATATFDTMEGWLQLDLRGDGLGHVAVTGIAKDRVSVGPASLDFTMPGMDQTYLPAIIDQLRAIESAFPVVNVPPERPPSTRSRWWRRS